MDKLRLEGLVVQALPFQEYDRIISILTPQEGLVKCIFKGGASLKNGGGGATAPLTVVEMIYTKGKSELLKCHEISVLNHHLTLRNSLSILEAACDMLQVVNHTQMPGKPCPDLYKLLLAYLDILPTAHDAATLSASFRLKVLRHEGLWRSFADCTICCCGLKESYFADGNAHCSRHAPPHALEISPSERDIFELLAFSRDLSLLASLPMTQDLTQKIRHLFADSFKH